MQVLAEVHHRHHLGTDFGAPDFVVVPVGFNAATTTVQVFFSRDDGSVVGVDRALPKTTGVLNAAIGHDLQVLVASVLMIALIYLIANFVADVLVAFLNPRVRLAT
jgi:ABC-type microcin C transport system permease subunit YejB